MRAAAVLPVLILLASCSSAWAQNACPNSGFWGDNCDKPCPSGHNCAIEDDCDKTTGLCLFVEGIPLCKDGFWGPDCVAQCSPAHHCNIAGCNEITGGCIESDMPLCADGFWGEECDKQCAADQHCAIPRQCDSSTGHCVVVRDLPVCDISIQASWWGEDCNKPCPANCARVGCDLTTGSCVPDRDGTLCKIGFWGPECTQACATGHCLLSQCDAATGHCVKGTPLNPNLPLCQGPFWGEDCDKSCPTNPRCLMDTCDEKTGECVPSMTVLSW